MSWMYDYYLWCKMAGFALADWKYVSLNNDWWLCWVHRGGGVFRSLDTNEVVGFN